MSAQGKWIVGIVAVLLVVALLACGIFFAWRYLFAGKPVVSIDSPPSNTEVQEGETLWVEVTASGGSIKRVELWVDEDPVDQVESPSAVDTFRAGLSWVAAELGRHMVEVRAYNTGGQESEPAAIIIRVVPMVGEATPTPTPSVGVMEETPSPTSPPAATATPTSPPSTATPTTPPSTATPTPTATSTATPTSTSIPPPPPSCPATFSSSTGTVEQGTSFDLSWHVENATALHLSGPAVGDDVPVTGPDGSRTVCCPAAGTHTYTLHVSCPAGDFDRQVTVTVNPAPPSVDFTAGYSGRWFCVYQRVSFQIKNTGGVALESIQMRVEWPVGTQIGGGSQNKPFRSTPTQPDPACLQEGEEKLDPGAARWVQVSIGSSAPPAHAAGRAWFKACSENGLGGTCKEVTIDYTY